MRDDAADDSDDEEPRTDDDDEEGGEGVTLDYRGPALRGGEPSWEDGEASA